MIAGATRPFEWTHPDPALRVVLEPIAPVRGRWCRFAIRFPPEGVVDVMVQVLGGW